MRAVREPGTLLSCIAHLAAICSLTVASHSQAATSVLSEALVTDVSDRSFAIVWTSSEAALPSVNVYLDAAATQTVTDAVITAFPVTTGSPHLDVTDQLMSRQQIADAARDRGMMKVSIAGLTPGTSYYVKISVDSQISQQLTTCPDDGISYCGSIGIMTATTTTSATRAYDPGSGDTLFNNDQLLLPISSGVTGDLVIIAVEGASTPVSRFIGDGVPAPSVLIDLNNLYDGGLSYRTLGSSPTASGDPGEVIVVRHYRGNLGSVSSYAGLSATSGTGDVSEAMTMTIGDCNRDNTVDSYDRLLAGRVIADGTPATDYPALPFHPLLCDLYRESGSNSLVTTPVLDVQDTDLLDSLLVGSTDPATLPQSP